MPEVTVDPVQAVPQRIEGRCVQGQVRDAEGLVGLHGRVSQLRDDLAGQQQVPPVAAGVRWDSVMKVLLQPLDPEMVSGGSCWYRQAPLR